MNDIVIPIFNWKLTSFADYMQVVILLVVSFLMLYLYTKHAQRKRQKAPAIKKVAKRLLAVLQKQRKVMPNTTLFFEDEAYPIDILAADKHGILLVEVFGRGLEIYGEASGETWKLVDREQSTSVQNPLPRLEECARLLKQQLAKEGIFGVPVLPLIVFADNFEEPKLFLGRRVPATTFQQLKQHLKGRSKGEGAVETEKVFAALDLIAVNRQKEE